MSKSYPEHYKWCKEEYKESLPDTYIPNITEQTLHNLTIQTGINRDDRIKELAEDAGKKFDVSNDKNNFAIFINDIWDIRHLSDISTEVIEILEMELFRCYAYVDHIHFYRTIESTAPRESSWLWHWDNNPAEQIKLMMYLNDVTEENAPFQYLRQKESGHVIKMQTSRTGPQEWRHQSSRLSSINNFLNKGYEVVSVVGDQGTYLLFDNNIIHRATSCNKGYRDVVIFNMRPCHFKIRPSGTPEYTGNWTHRDPVSDPMQYKPV